MPVAFLPTGGDDLLECMECGAVVTPSTEFTHEDWHKKLERMEHKFLSER